MIGGPFLDFYGHGGDSGDSGSINSSVDKK